MSNIEPQTGYYFYAFLLTFWNGKFNSSCPSYCSHYGCSSRGSRAKLFLMFLVSSPVSLTLHPHGAFPHAGTHIYSAQDWILSLEYQAS